jgi:hypothetical protein
MAGFRSVFGSGFSPWSAYFLLSSSRFAAEGYLESATAIAAARRVAIHAAATRIFTRRLSADLRWLPMPSHTPPPPLVRLPTPRCLSGCRHCPRRLRPAFAMSVTMPACAVCRHEACLSTPPQPCHAKRFRRSRFHCLMMPRR